jgi:ATP-binding cassette subfamily G (WHITE) protein 2 (PDR)
VVAVYYGDVGNNSKVLVDYFVRNGGPPCPPEANPAEWMLEVIGAAPGSHTDVDWHQAWRNSPEYAEVQRHLEELKVERSQLNRLERTVSAQKREDKAAYREFAAPFAEQFRETTKRVFQQYWRSPAYIYSKILLCVSSALFIGFSLYKMPNTQQGLQNQMFGVFMLMTIFGQLVQQIMPHFVTQRSLYEVRERPSKSYSWKAFMLSNILVELPWNSLMAVLIYFCWSYPIGLYRNAEPTDQVHYRGFQLFLFTWMFLIFTSTFTHMIIAGMESAETGGNIANLLFSLCLVFCGVLATPATFPRFWIFMYRLSPFTYLVSGLLATGLAKSTVECATNEFIHFDPPQGENCGTYIEGYKNMFGGYMQDPNATSDCQFCAIQSTDTFLASLSSSYDDVWRNFGILWVYVIFNIFAALALYWLIRMPKTKKEKVDKKEVGGHKGAAQEQMLDEPSHSHTDNEKVSNNATATTAERGPSTSHDKEISEKV